MTNIKNENRFNTVARIVADCPHCGNQCEIGDLKDNEDKEHCCMKCGNTLYFDTANS